MAEPRELTMRPIGRVIEGRPSSATQDRGEGQGAEIEIDPIWAPALEGIEAFSHLWVVWWLDRAQEPPPALRIRPERRQEMPQVGIFATRSPSRPNPVAITAVRLLERQGTRLRVQGLDACQGTPVLDLKPYLRRGDLIPEATAPPWLERLWHIHDVERET
jgi:tRNA-Thr(GGU) m(6)t(6)A37 methyltransferase TsaA